MEDVENVESRGVWNGRRRWVDGARRGKANNGRTNGPVAGSERDSRRAAERTKAQDDDREASRSEPSKWRPESGTAYCRRQKAIRHECPQARPYGSNAGTAGRGPKGV